MDEEQGIALLDLKDKKVNKSESSADGYPVLGEIICDDVLNSEEVISSIHEAWKNRIYGYVHITNIGYNKYLFKCHSPETALRVIQDGPWTIMGHFLCLELWKTEKSLEEIRLEYVRIWVRVHGLSDSDICDGQRDIGREIGNHIGVFVASDKWNYYNNREYGFIRIKVRMNCYETIKSGMWIDGERGKFRVDFKYENIAELCYNCGRFGHSSGSCGPMNIRNPQFGPWRRAEAIEFNYAEYPSAESTRNSLGMLFNAVLSCLIMGSLLYIVLILEFDH